jgi:hypothetical protein
MFMVGFPQQPQADGMLGTTEALAAIPLATLAGFASDGPPQ